MFELRIYEAATDQDHRRKVEMMQAGESEIFTKAGVTQVFYSDTLIGRRLPSLTYMLAFDNMAESPIPSLISGRADSQRHHTCPYHSFPPAATLPTCTGGSPCGPDVLF